MSLHTWRKMVTVGVLVVAHARCLASLEYAATTAVGGAHGVSLYMGAALLQLGGSLQNQAYTQSSSDAVYYGYYDSVVPEEPQGTEIGVPFDIISPNFYGDYMESSAEFTTTVGGLRFGAEGHIGMYMGGRGMGIGLEAFGTTRTSFFPSSSIQITDASFVYYDLTPSGTLPPVVSDVVTIGLSMQPNNLGYGLRIMPTLMLFDGYGVYAGIYASMGYGVQGFKGTLTNSLYAGALNFNPYYANTTALSPGTAGEGGADFVATFSGMNYGVGSSLNIGSAMRVYSFFEVQQFGQYTTSDLTASTATPSAVLAADSLESTPTTAAYTGQYYVIAQGYDAALSQQTGAFSVVDHGTLSCPSSITVQLRTFSVGVDYAFI